MHKFANACCISNCKNNILEGNEMSTNIVSNRFPKTQYENQFVHFVMAFIVLVGMYALVFTLIYAIINKVTGQSWPLLNTALATTIYWICFVFKNSANPLDLFWRFFVVVPANTILIGQQGTKFIAFVETALSFKNPFTIIMNSESNLNTEDINVKLATRVNTGVAPMVVNTEITLRIIRSEDMIPEEIALLFENPGSTLYRKGPVAQYKKLIGRIHQTITQALGKINEPSDAVNDHDALQVELNALFSTQSSSTINDAVSLTPIEKETGLNVIRMTIAGYKFNPAYERTQDRLNRADKALKQTYRQFGILDADDFNRKITTDAQKRNFDDAMKANLNAVFDGDGFINVTISGTGSTGGATPVIVPPSSASARNDVRDEKLPDTSDNLSEVKEEIFNKNQGTDAKNQRRRSVDVTFGLLITILWLSFITWNLLFTQSSPTPVADAGQNQVQNEVKPQTSNTPKTRTLTVFRTDEIVAPADGSWSEWYKVDTSVNYWGPSYSGNEIEVQTKYKNGETRSFIWTDNMTTEQIKNKLTFKEYYLRVKSKGELQDRLFKIKYYN